MLTRQTCFNADELTLRLGRSSFRRLFTFGLCRRLVVFVGLAFVSMIVMLVFIMTMLIVRMSMHLACELFPVNRYMEVAIQLLFTLDVFREL